MPGLFTCYLGRLAHFSTKYVVFIVKYYSFKKYYKFLESIVFGVLQKQGYYQLSIVCSQNTERYTPEGNTDS